MSYEKINSLLDYSRVFFFLLFANEYKFHEGREAVS